MRKELVTGLILALALVGYLEYRNAPAEKAMLENPQVGFVNPLPCDLTIKDGTITKMSQPRCYFFRTSR